MAGIDTSMYSQQPTTKLDIPGAISAAQGMQSLQASQFALGEKQLGLIRSTVGSLAQDPNVTPEKVQAAGQMLVQQGLVPPQQLQSFMQGLQGKTGQELRGALSNHLATMMSAHDTYLQANGGEPGAVSTGDGTALIGRSARSGVTNQAYVAARPSAEFNASTQDAPPQMGPDGRIYPAQETRGAAAARNGYTAPPVGAVGPRVTNSLVNPPASAAPPQRANPLTGQTPAAAPAVAASVAAPPAAAVTPSVAGGAALDRSASFPAPRIMGPAVGATGAYDKIAAASAEQGIALEKASDDATSRKATLSSMEDHLKNISTGPLSGAIKAVGSGVNQVASIANMDPIFKNAGERDKFDKLAATLQRQNAALGVSSDAGLANAGASTPNSSMTKEGIEGMIALGKGNEDAIRVKNQEWQRWKAQPGHGPDTYGQFQQDFQNRFEPRVFALPYMKPDAAKKMIAGLSEAEATKVDQAYKTAVQNGWIKRIKGN